MGICAKLPIQKKSTIRIEVRMVLEHLE